MAHSAVLALLLALSASAHPEPTSPSPLPGVDPPPAKPWSEPMGPGDALPEPVAPRIECAFEPAAFSAQETRAARAADPSVCCYASFVASAGD